MTNKFLRAELIMSSPVPGIVSVTEWTLRNLKEGKEERLLVKKCVCA